MYKVNHNMNNYTKTTKIWLEERFKETTESNVYFAHQPIYGFRDPNSEKYVLNRYIVTYQIMKALSHIKFDSLLDVGGAEGYKAAMIKFFFGVRVRNCDISSEACKRAKEIFKIESDTIDILKLPYKDNEFDVVLCSETLEHIPDLEAATKELIRVCKKAVIITVPNEPKEVIDYNVKNNIPHAHIHSLNKNSFDFINDKIDFKLVKNILHPLLNLPSAIIEASKKDSYSSSYSKKLIKFYNFFIPLFRFIFNEKAVCTIIKIDNLLSNKKLRHGGFIFILIKQSDCYSEKELKNVSCDSVINFKVPHYKLI